MISLAAIGERIAATAAAVDRVLALAPVEDFLADHDEADGQLNPKMYRVRVGEEEMKVALATMRRGGGLVCNELSISLESDVAAEGRDGQLMLTLKRSPVSRKSRIKIDAQFSRSEDPEGLELVRERLNTQPTQPTERAPTNG